MKVYLCVLCSGVGCIWRGGVFWCGAVYADTDCLISEWCVAMTERAFDKLKITLDPNA